MLEAVVAAILLALVAMPIAIVIREMTRCKTNAEITGKRGGIRWTFTGMPAIYAMTVAVLVAGFVYILNAM